MASEIQASASLSASKGGGSVSASANIAYTLTGSEMINTIQSISNSVTAVPVGGCDQIQVIQIRNMPYNSDGSANTSSITIGLDTPITKIVSVLPPGGFCQLVGLPSTTLYCQASAGTPDMQTTVVEN